MSTESDFLAGLVDEYNKSGRTKTVFYFDEYEHLRGFSKDALAKLSLSGIIEYHNDVCPWIKLNVK